MSNEPTASSATNTSDSKTSLNQGFTEGGDLTLQSLDGIEFSVHSILLSLASPVFSDMLTVGTRTKQDIVPVGETSEMVAIMLKFIYPLPPPSISSFEQLNQALHVADKYQLKGMRTRLRENLSLQTSPVSISSDPLRALAIASAYEFQEEADTATSLASKQHGFHQVDGLAKLAKLVPPSIPFIRLIGLPSVRIQILADVLFGFHQDPMQLKRPNWTISTLCSPCYYTYHESKLHSAPEWQARWAYAVFMELKGLPVQEWDPFFKIGFFNTALHRGGQVPIQLPKPTGNGSSNCKCPENINGSPAQFEEWAASVLQCLKTRLLSLGELERLKMS